MSEGELISHPLTEVTTTVASPVEPVTVKADIPAEPAKAETPTEAPAEAPSIESPAIQPRIEETVRIEPAPPVAITPPVVAAEAAPTAIASEPAPEAPAVESKMPPVAQLAEPIARLVGAPSDTPAPPPFLREHTNRIITAKPPLRAEPRPGAAPQAAAKPELGASRKPEPKIEAKIETKIESKIAPKLDPKADARTEPKAPRRGRFALLAASIAICAGIGAAAATAGIASVSRIMTPAPVGTTADLQSLREQVAQLAADVAATRTNVEHINRNTGTQFAKIVERFDRVERTQAQAQADPAAKLAKIGETLDKLAKIGETVDKLDKRIAALPAAPAPTAGDVTGSITPRPAPEPKPAAKSLILEGFVLRRVYDGVALVEGRMGVIELVPGAPLPGGGRVEDIRREDGHWVVVTSRGLIVSQR